MLIKTPMKFSYTHITITKIKRLITYYQDTEQLEIHC